MKKNATGRARRGPTLVRDLQALTSYTRAFADQKAAAYGGDKWFAYRQPDAVVLPKTTREVSQILAYASARKIPVTPRGAGYGYVGGCVPEKGGIVLSTEKMNRILEIHPADFVAVVQPAVITGHLQNEVTKKGLFYPPDPASLADCSLGGNIATNAGGPRCLKYGVTRNYILGLEVVLSDGTICRTGGRTHKNKTGFDLTGLFVGSEGLLGVVTEATLRLLPRPPFVGALSAGFVDIRAAARAIQGVFQNGFLPAAAEIADRFTLEAGRNYAPNRGRFRIPPGDAHVLLELDGQEASVRSELRSLRSILQKLGATKVDTGLGQVACDHLWELRRSFSESLKATGLKKLNQDVVVPRGKLVELVRFASSLRRKYQLEIACFGHAGDGNIHVNIMLDSPDSDRSQSDSKALLNELFGQVLDWKGAVTGEHGIGLARLPWWSQAASTELRDLHSRVKRALDPAGIMNPGKFAN